MSTNLSRTQVLSIWFFVVASLVALSLAGGVAAGPATWFAVFLISLLPPAVSLIVWRGAPPPTIAEVLYAADNEKPR